MYLSDSKHFNSSFQQSFYKIQTDLQGFTYNNFCTKLVWGTNRIGEKLNVVIKMIEVWNSIPIHTIRLIDSTRITDV